MQFIHALNAGLSVVWSQRCVPQQLARAPPSRASEASALSCSQTHVAPRLAAGGGSVPPDGVPARPASLRECSERMVRCRSFVRRSPPTGFT
jgi:hypothetical protein